MRRVQRTREARTLYEHDALFTARTSRPSRITTEDKSDVRFSGGISVDLLIRRRGASDRITDEFLSRGSDYDVKGVGNPSEYKVSVTKLTKQLLSINKLPSFCMLPRALHCQGHRGGFVLRERIEVMFDPSHT